MHLATGFQPFRPSPSTESFLAPLLLDVIVEEKFNGYKAADLMYLGCRYLALTAWSPMAVPYVVFAASFVCTFRGKNIS